MEELNKELATEKPDFQAKVGASKTDASANPLKTSHRRPFNKANREYEMYRLKLTFGEAKRKELFAELKDYNERLEKLLATSDTLSEVEAKRKNQAASWRTTKGSTVGQLWRHADRLYKALNRSWSCQCVDQHQAKLRLEHAKSTEQGYTLLLLSGTTGSALQSWSLCETRITMSDAWVATVPILSSAPGQSTPQHRTAQPTSSAMAGRRKATQTGVQKPRPQINVTSSKLDPPKRDQGDGKHISCLCNAFSSQKQPHEPYGYLRDNEKQFQVCPGTGQHVTVGNDGDIVTLDDLLRKKHQMLRNRRKRYSLALILASSFLQLRDSQCLPSAWQKGDISFLRDAKDDTLLLDRPCLTRGFSRGKDDVCVKTQHSDAISSISLLGIVLLELCFGRLIEEHPSRQRCPPGDEQSAPVFDLLAAVEWLREVGDEAGPDYKCAAEWCLLGSRSAPSGDAWRQMLFENVVLPLERCHVYLNSNV